MARNLNPKCKQCRRQGVKLFLRGDRCNSPKCAMIKKNYPPGMHGIKKQVRLSGYGLQLREKQKAKKIYRLMEQQFRNYYEKAIKRKGDTGELLLQFLERRFDNIVFRLGLAKSRDTARQLITHGHFEINKRSVNIPSVQIKVNDIISVKPNKIKDKYWSNLIKEIEKNNLPKWLYLDKKILSGKIISFPKKEELPQDINSYLIVEFYSR